MKKTTPLRIIKFLLPLVFLFFLIFELQRSFTDFPQVRFYIIPGSESDKLAQGTDIYSLLGNWNTFAYYTTLSNILFAATILLKWTFSFKISRYWIASITINMVLTGVIFWTSIAPFMPWGQNSYYDFINTYEHGITVLGSFIFLYLSKKTSESSLKIAILVSLIIPILYLIFAIIIWVITKNGIYPFLDFDNFFAMGMTKVASVFACIFTILGIMIAIILMSIIFTDLHALKKIWKKCIAKLSANLPKNT